MKLNIEFDEHDVIAMGLIENNLNGFINSVNETNLCIIKYDLNNGTTYLVRTNKTKNGFNILIKKEEGNE